MKKVVIDWLKKKNCPYATFEDQDILYIPFHGKRANYQVILHCSEGESHSCIVCSSTGLRVPEEKLSQVAEFVARVNFGLMHGHFELDFNSGEIRFATSIASEQDDLSESMISPLIHGNFITHDRTLPALYDVIFRGVSPKEAALKLRKQKAADQKEIDKVVAKLLANIEEPASGEIPQDSCIPSPEENPASPKRKRGRPKKSRNKPKTEEDAGKRSTKNEEEV